MIKALLRIALTLGLVAFVQVPALLHEAPAAADPDNNSTPSPTDAYNPVVVVLDTSGSMGETDATGKEKIVSARAAVLDLVDALAPQTPFGLIAYPGNNARTVSGCSIGAVEVPLGPLDQSVASAAVRRLTPDGDTPTAPALKHAAAIIKRSATQRGTIVLVSDGESNCGGDVCQMAKELSATGVEVRVNTVGFLISSEGADELNCIASVTGGRYVDAQDADALEDALQDLSGARLELTASVPNPLPVVSGTGSEGPRARLTVSNTGRKPATDVRLSLDFRDSKGTAGAVLIPRPVRFQGNIGPGQTRTVDLVVRPDAARLETFTWVATATADNARPRRQEGQTTTVEPFGTLTGLLDGVKHLAVLGDSYSSGQGTGDYIAGTHADRAGANECRRSPKAYGRVLLAEADLIACGGAVTANFYEHQQSGSAKMRPQLLQLRDLALSDRSPDAVLLSIGGNDVGFVEFAARCMLGPVGTTCGMDALEVKNLYGEAAARVAAIANSLLRVYRDVNRAVNDAHAREHRGGKYAPIIVVPYPRIVPSERAGSVAAARCQLLINEQEVAFFNYFVDLLNLEIAAAVGSLRSDAVPVRIASDVISAFQPDHTICDRDNSYAVANRDLAKIWPPAPELLHPNVEGNMAMARTVSAWAAEQTPITNPAEVSWHAIGVKKLTPVENLVAHTVLDAAGVYMIGGDAPIDAKGFVPTSTIVFRMDSTPRILGTAVADSDGNIQARVPIPSDTKRGTHTIHVLGIDPSGTMHEVTTTIRVVPPHTLGAAVTVALGVITTGLGLIGIRRHRKLSTGQARNDVHA